jgi:mevalonate kinase
VAKRRRTGRLDSAAAAIGGSLGHVAAKVEALKKQREEIAAELRELISTAQGMLNDLGAETATFQRRVKKVVHRRRRRTFTQAQRTEISRRMKALWAKRRSGR